MTFPLTKAWDPADLSTDLIPESVMVATAFGTASPQHEMRRWEYAMALRAIIRWEVVSQHPIRPLTCYDVGGAGSPFWRMVPYQVQIIDPAAEDGQTLAAFVATHPPKHRIVTCLSVLEHILILEPFCADLASLVLPGGLLLLTFDYQPDDTLDQKMFHWMRQRIFTPTSWQKLAGDFSALGFDLFDSVDWTFHAGWENWGYCPASLALRKRA